MKNDLIYALRGLRRKPLFTLALGIGANSAILTVVNAVLLKDVTGEAESRRSEA